MSNKLQEQLSKEGGAAHKTISCCHTKVCYKK